VHVLVEVPWQPLINTWVGQGKNNNPVCPSTDVLTEHPDDHQSHLARQIFVFIESVFNEYNSNKTNDVAIKAQF